MNRWLVSRIVARRQPGGEEVEVAVARYIVGEDGETCEFAIVVGDGWQRQRIATALMKLLIEAAREREKTLTFVIEHVLLLAIEILDRKPVDRQVGILRHPGLNRCQRNGQQFGIEPRARLTGFGEENLDLLPLGVDLIVALILVVPERGEIPDLVRQLSDLVG